MSGFGWNEYSPPPTAANVRRPTEEHRDPPKPGRRGRRSFKARLVLIAALLALASAAGVLAYWTTTGNGSASASIATLNPPTGVTVPSNSTGTVHVSWTASNTGGGGVTPQGYYVESNSGGPTWALACSSSPTSLLSGTSCDDSQATGFYTYRVTAVFNSWTAQSTGSGSVHVVTDATPPVVLVTTVNGNTVTFPFSTNQDITSIGGTCGTAVGDLTPVNWSIDSQSGVATCSGGGTWSSGALTAISVEGSYTAAASQSDNASNTGNDSKLIRLDKTSPVVPITSVNGNPASFPSAFNVNVTDVGGTCGILTGDSATISVAITGTASQSGTATCSGGSWSYTMSPVLSADGGYTVTATQDDAAGNTGSSGPKAITIDKTAPATTITLNPTSPNGTGGWYDGTSPTFTLSASDTGGTGVAMTKYQIDSGAITTYPGSAVSIPDGLHTVSYWSIDNAGNTETTHTTATIKVDTVNPSTTFSISPTSPDGSNGWYTSHPVFTLAATDGSSGVATMMYQLDGGTAHNYAVPVTIFDGQHTISYWSVDAAGNTETTHTTATIKVDAQAPNSALGTIPGAPDGANGWFKAASVTFVFGSFDAFSGVASTFYTIDGGATQTYSGAVVINTQGDHTVTYWSTDNAGNVEATNTTHIKLDNVGPSLSLALAASPVGASFTAPGTVTYRASAIGSFQFAATVTDGTSGAASATYPVIGTAGWSHASETVTGSSPYASTTFSWSASPTNPSGYIVTATDQAGNTTTQAISLRRRHRAADALDPPDVRHRRQRQGRPGRRDVQRHSQLLHCPVHDWMDACERALRRHPLVGHRLWNRRDPQHQRGCRRRQHCPWHIQGHAREHERDHRRGRKPLVVYGHGAGGQGGAGCSSLEMLDTNTDGKVDHVAITFSEPLAAYTAANAPWTLANVPSGGSLLSVTVASPVVTSQSDAGRRRC